MSGSAIYAAGERDDAVAAPAAAAAACPECEAHKGSVEARARFFDTVELAAVGIAHVSVDGRILYANQSLCALLGYAREELIGVSVRDVSPPEELEAVLRLRAELHCGRIDSFHREKRYVRKDGSTVWAHLHVALKRGAQGEPLYDVAVIEDISARKRAEDALHEREERAQDLAALSSDWYWEQDEQFRFLDIVEAGARPERRARRHVGKRRWELEDTNLSAEQWAAHRAQLERREPFFDFEYRRVGLHGKAHWVSVSGTPVFDADGRFRGYRGVGKDITARKEAEAALRESEARFRSLTTLSNDWYWEVDAEFRFRRVEGRVLRFLGDYAGKRLGELGLAVDGLSEEMRGAFAAHRSFRDLTLSLKGEDGPIIVSISCEPIFDAEGRFDGYRGVGRDITARKRAEARIEYLATHDGLTGLPNRTMFHQLLNLTIESARRYERKFALLFMDLDRFKLINDSLGHEAGDRLLIEVAGRLKRTLRASDVVARLSGDEFVVLLQEVGEASQAGAAASKIIAAVAEPVELAGQECRVTASIGIAMYPADGQDERTLMKNADIALYLAKEEGRNNFHFYSKDIKRQALERLTLETNLRRALERDEFSLQYQAKLDLRSGAICGVEALLRWNNPELGSVSPAQFIPLAEETGLIIPIGKWVLNTACAQAVAWRRRGLPPVCIAVNLSARQFADPNLLDDVAGALRRTGLEPELLELELTESMVMHNPDQAVQTLKAIKDMGVRLAIDDFGTGYSSLAQLKRFPIDTLKVDRSFIREIPKESDDKAIAQAIIGLAKTLSLTVVAEGVETLEQQTFLTDHACDQIQGYYFSRPVPETQFAELLRRHVPACSKAEARAEAAAA